MGLLGRFWRSNGLNEIGFYRCLNEKALRETEIVCVAWRRERVEGQRSNVNVKVNYHHHIR